MCGSCDIQNVAANHSLFLPQNSLGEFAARQALSTEQVNLELDRKSHALYLLARRFAQEGLRIDATYDYEDDSKDFVPQPDGFDWWGWGVVPNGCFLYRSFCICHVSCRSYYIRPVSPSHYMIHNQSFSFKTKIHGKIGTARWERRKDGTPKVHSVSSDGTSKIHKIIYMFQPGLADDWVWRPSEQIVVASVCPDAAFSTSGGGGETKKGKTCLDRGTLLGRE